MTNFYIPLRLSVNGEVLKEKYNNNLFNLPLVEKNEISSK